MAVTTTREIVDSYIGLLIMQYLSKPKAAAHINTLASPAVIPQVSVQEITFASAPVSGTFVLSYDDVNIAAINWDDSAAAIQTKIQVVVPGATVTGTIAGLSLIVSFVSTAPPALALTLVSNSLAVGITITETDLTIPLAVQDAFNFAIGSDLAAGVQLDVIGKYVGVTRTGLGFANSAVINLDDEDFISLIHMGIIKNQAGSSLGTIQNYVHSFFPGGIYIFDHADMTMTYVIGAEVGSFNLVQLFVTEGLIPAPMAVRTNVFYVPTANVFSFRTYNLPNNSGHPFNTYEAYEMSGSWLTYQNLVV